MTAEQETIVGEKNQEAFYFDHKFWDRKSGQEAAGQFLCSLGHQLSGTQLADALVRRLQNGVPPRLAG